MKWHTIIPLILVFLLPNVMAVDFDQELTDEDKAKFDEILNPIVKVYNFVKYAASVCAVMVLLFAGIKFMSNGNNPLRRDEAKGMATYVVVGLFVIWAAPLVVSYLI